MTNTFATCVRREIWEHKSVWVAPLAMAAFLCVALVFGMTHFTGNYSGSFSSLSPEKQRQIVTTPFGLAASVILVTSMVVAVFYSVDALFAERRDRSILFWKSMPVSDATTVLSKFFVPTIVIPAIAVPIALAVQGVLLVFATVAMNMRGIDTALMYDNLPIASMTVGLVYGVLVHIAWYAPIWALLLLISTWARSPKLWVAAPLFVLPLTEKIVWGTDHVGHFIAYRILGAVAEAFTPGGMKGPVTAFSQLDPIRYLSSPGLWLGLLAAAAFLYAAIRLRRSREPLS